MGRDGDIARSSMILRSLGKVCVREEEARWSRTIIGRERGQRLVGEEVEE